MTKSAASTKITRFDRATCKTACDKVEAALKHLEAELGVAIQIRGGSFSADSYVLKIELATVGDGGVVMDREATDFKASARLFGLKPEHLGAEFECRGRRAKVIGLRPRAGKFPIIGKWLDTGVEACFSADYVSRALGSNPPVAAEAR